VPFDSVRRFRATLLLRTTCMRLWGNWFASCVAALQTKNQKPIYCLIQTTMSELFCARIQLVRVLTRSHNHGVWNHSSSSSTLIYIDWCCFYYFVRNGLVALLEALCAQYPSLCKYRCNYRVHVVCTCIHAWVMYICICMYIYTHSCIRTHTHTHTRIYTNHI